MTCPVGNSKENALLRYLVKSRLLTLSSRAKFHARRFARAWDLVEGSAVRLEFPFVGTKIQLKEAHMENIISNLLGRYERGTLTRRELIQGLAMLAVASGTVLAADTGFAATSINHVSIQVSDI